MEDNKQAFTRTDNLLKQKEKDNELRVGEFRTIATEMENNPRIAEKWYGLRMDNTFDDFASTKAGIVREWTMASAMCGVILVIDSLLLFDIPIFSKGAQSIPHIGGAFFNKSMMTAALTIGTFYSWGGLMVAIHMVLGLIQCDTHDEYQLLVFKAKYPGKQSQTECIWSATLNCPKQIYPCALTMYVFDTFMILCPVLCPMMIINNCVGDRQILKVERTGELINRHRLELKRRVSSEDMMVNDDDATVYVILKGAQLGEYVNTYFDSVGGAMYAEKRQFTQWLIRVVASDYNEGVINRTSRVVAMKLFDRYVERAMKEEIRNSYNEDDTQNMEDELGDTGDTGGIQLDLVPSDEEAEEE